MVRRFLALSSLAAALLMTGLAPASAQSRQTMLNWCIGKNSPTPEQMARGCTALIDGRSFKGMVLGTIYLNRGLAYKNMGQNDRALKEYNRAVELAPRFPLCYINRAAVYYEAGKFDLALTDAAKAIELNPKATLGYYNHGNTLLKQGKNAEAMADFDKAVALDPKYGPAYNNRANVKLTLKDYDGAIADATMAIKLVPASATAASHALPYGTRAEGHKQKKDWPNAIKDISAAIDLDPQQQRLGLRSYYNEMNGTPELCIPDLNRILAVNPNNAAAYADRCWVNGILNKLDEGMADCTKSNEMAPNVSNTILKRAIIALKQGKNDKALADFEASLQLQGYAPDGAVSESVASSLYGRGLVRQKMGDTLGGTIDLAAARKASSDVGDAYKRTGL